MIAQNVGSQNIVHRTCDPLSVAELQCSNIHDETDTVVRYNNQLNIRSSYTTSSPSRDPGNMGTHFPDRS